MHVGVYGSGYLGCVVSACLSDFGMPITCFDEDFNRVAGVAQGVVPFYERNLQEVVRRNMRAGRLIYASGIASPASKCEVVFIAQDSQAGVEEVAARIAGAMRKGFVVLMTPVPVGTAKRLEARLHDTVSKVCVVSQPLFLTDGCAVEDFNWPDRILLGTSSSDAVQLLKQIYRPLVMRGVPVIVTNHETAELVRESATAFVATKISFINELATLCERVNADAVNLSLALGLDKKIAPRCLQPGAGMGGLFAESDMDSLADLAGRHGVSLRVLSAAREVNQNLAENVVEKISTFVDTVQNKDVGILGLAFKPNTNSVAGSSSVRLAQTLIAKGARVRAYDPVAIPDARTELNGTVYYCESPYAAAEGVDALVVGTGWPEFRTLDFDRIKHLLRRPVIVDTKNLLDSVRLRAMGFEYVGVGRG